MSVDECQSEASPNIDRLISYIICQCCDSDQIISIKVGICQSWDPDIEDAAAEIRDRLKRAIQTV